MRNGEKYHESLDSIPEVLGFFSLASNKKHAAKAITELTNGPPAGTGFQVPILG